jgi:hypothetical protein
MLQVLHHEIVVAYEEDYMELKDKTDEDSGTDAASTVSFHPTFYYFHALVPRTNARHQTIFLVS